MPFLMHPSCQRLHHFYQRKLAGGVETFSQFLLEVVTSQKSLPDKAQSRAE